MRAERVALAALLAFAVPLKAQTFPDGNGAALAGVDEVDARFLLEAWLNGDRDQDLFQENSERAFVLALRRDGVGVEVSAPNYLYCLVSVASAPAGTVFVLTVEFYDFNPDGVHTLLWRNGTIRTLGSDDPFTPELVAGECADTFASEWLRWNR